MCQITMQKGTYVLYENPVVGIVLVLDFVCQKNFKDLVKKLTFSTSKQLERRVSCAISALD